MKSAIPKPRMGLVLTGPKKRSRLMFGGPISVPKVGRKVWKTGPVLDQRETSACVGFAWTQFLMSEPSTTAFLGDRSDFAFKLYREAQGNDEWEGEEPEYYGTTIEAGHAALLKRSLVSPDLYWGTTIGQITQHLIEVGPVVMGTEWTSGMMKADDAGFIRPLGYNVGGHAYLFYGVSVKQAEFYGINSWGEENFGLKGKFKIRFADVQTLLNRAGYGVTCFEEAKG